jgi:tetratricopeptide (TPR) repeat protein
MEVLASILRVAPARAYDLDRQARDLFRAKQYEKALERSRQAVSLKPNDPILNNNLGYLYYVLGRNDEALSYLETTLQLDPKRKEAHGNIARAHYEEYLRLYPGSPKAEEFRRILPSPFLSRLRSAAAAFRISAAEMTPSPSASSASIRSIRTGPPRVDAWPAGRRRTITNSIGTSGVEPG